MKTILALKLPALVLLTLATLINQPPSAFAQGTAFTYQGRLNVGGSPASGSYNLLFTLYSTSTSGSPVAGPLTNTAVTVTNGLFTTAIDFGAGVFLGSSNWLEIAVSTNGANSFTTLVPRQQVTPTPYALYAPNAGAASTAGAVSGTISASQLTGTLSSGQLSGSYSGPVTFLNGANSFGGNGGGLTNLSLSGIGPAGTFTLLPFYFGPPVNLPVNAYVYAVQLLDVNGDGLPDLILSCEASSGNGLFEVYTNAGGGNFILASTNLDGNGQIYSIAAGDFNGDGKTDLVAADPVGVTIYQGFGNGTFTPVLTNAVGGIIFFRCVAVTDINGDGHPDIVMGNGFANPGYLSTLLNFGAGGFAFTLAQTITINDYLTALITRDVNGDGQPDIICAGQYNGLNIYTNRNGVFTLASTNRLGSQASGLVAGDVNGGGRPDLITVNPYLNTLTVFTNAGGGIFSSNQSISVGNTPISAVAVTNSAGLVTYLGVANGSDGTVSVLANDGRGDFTAVGQANVGQFEGFSDPVQALATADINGDGKPDFVAATGYNNYVTELFGYPQVLAMQGPVSLTNGENVIDGYFSGNGSSLSNLNASQITSGTLSMAQLPAGLATLSGNQIFSGQNQFTSANNDFTAYSYTGSYFYGGHFIGSASGLTGLIAGQLTGTVPLAALPTPMVVTNGAAGVTLSGTFSGNGGGLTALNAAQLSGAVPSATLTSVPAANLTGALPAISGASLTSLPAANLTGTLPAISGASLTSLNASQLTTGTVPSARIAGPYSSAVTFNNAGNSFVGSMQVGNTGTTFTQVEAGQATMPPSSTTETNFLINYPQAFTSAPKVVATIAFAIQGVNDIYAINVSSNSTTAFRVNVMRLDTTGGWGQDLLINWQAWQ